LSWYFTFLSNLGKSLLNIIRGSCTCSLTSHLYSMYSCSSPMRPHLLQWKSGHIRGVASIEGDNFVVFYHSSASEIFGWSGLIRVMDSLGGQFSIILLSQWIWNLWMEWSYKRGTNILQSDWSSNISYSIKPVQQRYNWNIVESGVKQHNIKHLTLYNKEIINLNNVIKFEMKLFWFFKKKIHSVHICYALTVSVYIQKCFIDINYKIY
jgi:hypothetical protein